MGVTREFLSASTNGKGIEVTSTATPGTLIHTAHATAIDEIWLWVGSAGAAQTLVIEFGGTTSPGDVFEAAVSATAGTLIAASPGLRLTNNLVVRVYDSTGSGGQYVHGYVNRYT